MDGVELAFDVSGVVLRASGHRHVEHHARLGIDRRVLLAGGLHAPRPAVGRQAGVRVGPADIGAHQRAVDVHHLTLGDAGRHAGPTVRVKIRRHRSVPERLRMRVRLEWSGSAAVKP